MGEVRRRQRATGGCGRWVGRGPASARRAGHGGVVAGEDELDDLRGVGQGRGHDVRTGRRELVGEQTREQQVRRHGHPRSAAAAQRGHRRLDGRLRSGPEGRFHRPPAGVAPPRGERPHRVEGAGLGRPRCRQDHRRVAVAGARRPPRPAVAPAQPRAAGPAPARRPGSPVHRRARARPGCRPGCGTPRPAAAGPRRTARSAWRRARTGPARRGRGTPRGRSDRAGPGGRRPPASAVATAAAGSRLPWATATSAGWVTPGPRAGPPPSPRR